MCKKNIIYRLYIDVKYISPDAETYSGIVLDLNNKNERKTIIFNNSCITTDTINMIKYVYNDVGFNNIESISYKENYETYLLNSNKYYEKTYKGSIFRLPLVKQVKSKEDIKWFYLMDSNNNNNFTTTKMKF